MARQGARLLLQTALEGEVTGFLGRNRYERRRLAGVARVPNRSSIRARMRALGDPRTATGVGPLRVCRLSGGPTPVVQLHRGRVAALSSRVGS